MKELTHICRGFTDEQWKGLRERLIRDGEIQDDEAAWNCAVEVFERRIRERFLSCVETLEKADSRSDVEVEAGAPGDCSRLPDDKGAVIVVPGFAIMALCCLLIETLQSFREAPEPQAPVTGPCSYPQGPCIRPPSSTADLFREFLQRPSFHGEFDGEIATRFVRGIRDGILHEAETRRWVIWRDQPVGHILGSYGDGYALNRAAFYGALKSEFENYLQELREPRNQVLRKRFVKKMNDIVKEV
ncbi:MAG: hypothetical protein ACE5JQ_15690 [Candidatus Methylomirabilales bacterium]